MKNKLRPVEEVILQFHMAGDFEPSEPVKTDYEVKEILTQDRHAIHTLLREGVESKRKVGVAFEDHYLDSYDQTYNIALDDILTFIDGIFVTNSDHENN